MITKGKTRTMNYFEKRYISAIKGIAIIMMVTLHLLQEGWMKSVPVLFDFKIDGSYFSSIIAYACDICIGVFAFVTGYGWETSFESKPKYIRILKLYRMYWIILLVFAFPARVINCYINDIAINIDAIEIIYALLGIKSESVLFQWYVFFFLLAVISYSYIWKIFVNMRIKVIYKFFLQIVVSIIPRIMLSYIWSVLSMPDLLRDIFSHYITWMPVIIIGSMVKKYKIFEEIDNRAKRIPKIQMAVISTAFLILSLIIKGLLRKEFGFTTNVDSIYIVPFMYSLVRIIKEVYGCRIEKMLRI